MEGSGLEQDGGPSIAVFLGPSLPRDEAVALLDALYLPPAQFGDVYRLIGSGVRAILLVDGVFHGRASVWQREILCALENGIRVYGAASMGALRAAELCAHGMIGIGAVFEQYVSGDIDGDDEVALLHEGPEQGYRSLSVPLVNLRATLREAVYRGLLFSFQADALIANLKALPFWERTSDAVRDAPALRAIEPFEQDRLCAFLAREAVDQKRCDAALALGEVARLERDLPPSAELTSMPVARPSHHDRFRLLRRAFPRQGGEPLPGQALSDWALAEPARRRLIHWSLAARFFVRRWVCEDEQALAAAASEAMPDSVPPATDLLRANALTLAEHAALRSHNAPLQWLLKQSPSRFGLPGILQDEELLSVLPDLDLGGLRKVASRGAIARALPYVAAWCECVGAAPSEEARALLTPRFRDALALLAAHGESSACEPFLRAVWALSKGPPHFGYTMWSLPSELLTELQRTFAAAELARQWGPSGA